MNGTVGTVPKLHLVPTPFGEYEATIRATNKAADERQTAIGEAANQLGLAADACEAERIARNQLAWDNYQAAIRGAH